MKIINLLTFIVIYVSAENPYNSSAARMRSVDLLSLISGKGPGQVQTFLEDYTPQIHDHSHKHKYKHKHAHQHRLVVKQNCRSADQKCRNHKKGFWLRFSFCQNVFALQSWVWTHSNPHPCSWPLSHTRPCPQVGNIIIRTQMTNPSILLRHKHNHIHDETEEHNHDHKEGHTHRHVQVICHEVTNKI